VHVTCRVRDTVWNLRSRRCFRVIEAALAGSRDRGLIRVVRFSVQGNHLHLVVEAADAAALARGMKGLAVRIARALNRLMAARGAVFADRYHAHVLRTPAEVRNALAYVAHNHGNHMERIGSAAGCGAEDPYSSESLDGRVVTSAPRTWLLAIALGGEERLVW